MSSPWDSPQQDSWPKRTANPFSNWSGDSQSVIGGNGDDIFDYQGEPVDERPNYNFSAQVAVNNPAADDIFGAGSVLQTTPYSTYSEPANSVSSAASAVVVPEDDGSLFSEIEEAKAAPSPVIPDDSNSGAHYATVDIDDEDKVELSHSEEKPEAEIKQEQLPLDNANFFEIEVPRTEIMNGGDYVAYHVHTKTMLNLYKNNEMNVKRRYSDFVWLQEQLLNNHKGIIIPPLPDKAIMQTSKLIGSSRLNDAFTEYRRKELDRFLKRVASHPTLCTSKYLQIFLETEDSSILKATKADPEEKAGQSSSGGWGSFFGKVVGSNSATEIDPYFEDKQAYIRELTKQMDLMAKMASNLIAKHIEMVSTYTQFSDAARALSKLESSSNNTLARSYNHLADISVQSHQLEQELSENAAVAFSDNIKDYVRLLQNVQKVLDTRLEKLAAFQAATKDLDQKRQKSNAKPAEMKLKTAVDQAEKVLEESKEVFDSISQLVKSELERFEATKAQEMHYAIFEFAQLNMNHEIRVLDLWKNFINEQ